MASIFYRRFILANLLVIATAIGAACGGSSSSSPSTPATPASYGAKTGSGQSVSVGQNFSTALSIIVLDAQSAPVSNAVVTFAVTPADNGASAVLSSASATTDATGKASITVKANDIAGTYWVSAQATGLAAQTFGLSNVSVAANALTCTDGVIYDAASAVAPTVNAYNSANEMLLSPPTGMQTSLQLIAMPTSGFSQTIANGLVTLDSTRQPTMSGFPIPGTNTFTPYAGYSTVMKPLNNGVGYVVKWSMRVDSEDHSESTVDKNNDGLPDRAGTSLIAVSSDGLSAIELGFFADKVFAQETDSVNPPAGKLFTQAESASITTNDGVHSYELIVVGSTYRLLQDGTQVLSGKLRNYYTPGMAIYGSGKGIEVYGMSNLVFLGDNTTSAKGRMSLQSMSARQYCQS